MSVLLNFMIYDFDSFLSRILLPLLLSCTILWFSRLVYASYIKTGTGWCSPARPALV